MPFKILADDKVTAKPPQPDTVVPEPILQPQRQSPATLLPRGRINPRSLAKGAVLQLQSLIGNRAIGRLIARDAEQPVQRKPPANQENKIVPKQPENRTGLPDNLKSGLEALSGLALDDVRVHYNSAKPAQLNAAAYTQGSEIHIGPGQERHLPHEAWHVVQQKQGRVQPTSQVSGAPLNDNPQLEKEADLMGARALAAPASVSEIKLEEPKKPDQAPVVQLTLAQIDYSVGARNTHVNGDVVGMGGVGGVSDSEQTAWNRAQAGILAQLAQAGRQVDIEFSVDTKVCDGCVRWFENTIHPLLTRTANANHSTFKLSVEVNGNRVEVNGTNTIWTPEVADTHRFDRLSAIERSLRYLRENRESQGDTEGRVRAAARGAYLDDQMERLEDLLALRHQDLSPDSIEADLAEGKRQAAAFIGEGIYNTDADGLTPEAYLDTLLFADVMFSGRFVIPDLPTQDDAGEVLGTRSAQIAQWHQNLQQDLKFYMTQAIDEHFEDYRVALEEVENPHHR